MRTLILALSLLLTAASLIAQDQPISWTGISGGSPAHGIPQSPPADDLQVLPADPLLYAQQPGCWSLASSEIITDFLLQSNGADDFIFTSGKNISAIMWWFGYFNYTYSPFTNWTVTIYDEAACLPENIVQQWVIPFNQSHETYFCDPFPGTPGWSSTYQYWADLTPAFTATANKKYWLSVQAGDHVFPGQWGWDTTIPVSGCDAAFKSVYFGYPSYTGVFDVFGSHFDFSFGLYGTDYNPPVATPVSSWALYFGIGLILVFALVRFRRIF